MAPRTLRRIDALSTTLALVAVALLAPLTACHQKAPQSDAAWSPSAWGPGDAGLPASLEGSLMIGRRAIDLGIYLPSSPSVDEVASAQKMAKARLRHVTILTAPEHAELPTALIFSPMISTLPPPPLELIHSDGRGIKPGQAEAIASSKGLIAMVVRLDDDPTLAHLHDVQLLALAIARTNDGAIWEESTREIYSSTEWQKVRVNGWEEDRPEVRRHISLHYDDSAAGHGRLVTLGMEKFGLPDLVVPGVAPNDLGNATRVIDGVAQLLVEGAMLDRGGILHFDLGAVKHREARDAFLAAAGPIAKTRAAVTLTPVLPEMGDPENRLVEIHFPAAPIPVVSSAVAPEASTAQPTPPPDGGRPR